MSKPGEWWKKSFGDAEVQWRLHECYQTCTSSDAGERCVERGVYVIAFVVDGVIGVSTVCRRHRRKWEDEADAGGGVLQGRDDKTPFPMIDDIDQEDA